ncbi:MAG: hypothetical protein OMM_03739 [Candidatus Magnetoglobus multicellularis str. Araruama]|uniref:Uncharacterized protein n=1 Tax=Candidatus Magnetoglobus multicellularis str. Araruama TaxID=890399 RepID=A0A1V1P4H8_9BACT|nr:MAG: hypothetical protein OMM_03739 [Candidatus Magnetoglobus multicellularis str. Araruama]
MAECDVCYGVKKFETNTKWCEDMYPGVGRHSFTRYSYDSKGLKSYFLHNSYSGKDMIFNKHIRTETRYRTYYYGQHMNYYTTGQFIIGRGFSSYYFQGKIKEVRFLVNGRYKGLWYFNDGNQSNTARNYYISNYPMTLYNFDTESCWFINPDLRKLYEFDPIQERQTIPKFKMTGNAKVTYDWGRQHAVIVNTLPDDLNELVTVKDVYDDDSQDLKKGAGKFWYNHGSKISIKALEDSCQKTLRIS